MAHGKRLEIDPPPLPESLELAVQALPPLASADQVAALLGVGRKTVILYATEGRLTGLRSPGPAGRWRFTPEAVRAHLRAMQANGSRGQDGGR
jgi:excisionase family DNA binding protein